MASIPTKSIEDDTSITKKKFTELVKRFCTPETEALHLLKERQSKHTLKQQISRYLQGDFPIQFSYEMPVLYLCRHIASPTFETLRFIEQCKNHNLPLYIGEDTQGKFTSINLHKKSLGKLGIVKGINRLHDEIIEYFSIIDFRMFDGKKFCDIKTLTGESLIDYHHKLIQVIYPSTVNISDESDWIQRHCREDIVEQYKNLLALLITQGIMYEFYYPEDINFMENVIIPAFEFIENMFGHKPLIVQMMNEHDTEREMVRYPSVLYPIINKEFINKRYKL